MLMRAWLLLVILYSAHLAAVDTAQEGVVVGPNPSAVRFFRERIEPVLVEHCYECHGGKKKYGGLRLDNLPAFLEGGHEGVTLVPGEPDKGLLMPALRWEGDSDLNMPPKSKLPAAVIADFEQWIRIGAPWPADAPMVTATVAPPRPPLVGRFHPLLVHLPIGALVVAALAEVLVLVRGVTWSRAVSAALVVAAIGAALAVGSGILLEGNQDPLLLERHEMMGWATLVGAVAAASLALWRQRHPGSRLPLRLVLAAALIAMSLAGHLGGSMVYGSDWLW